MFQRHVNTDNAHQDSMDGEVTNRRRWHSPKRIVLSDGTQWMSTRRQRAQAEMRGPFIATHDVSVKSIPHLDGALRSNHSCRLDSMDSVSAFSQQGHGSIHAHGNEGYTSPKRDKLPDPGRLELKRDVNLPRYSWSTQVVIFSNHWRFR